MSVEKNYQDDLSIDNAFLDDNGSNNNEVGQLETTHVLACTVLDKDTLKRNASGDEVDTTYLDYIETSETKNKAMKLYKYKIVESGCIIEIYKYAQENYKIIKQNNTYLNKETELTVLRENKKTKLDQPYKRSENTIYETRRRLKRLINANVGQYETKDKFITLTFKEFLTREEVIKSFKNFNKRLRYNLNGIEYQYIAVIEKGGRGTQRLHLHCLFFNLPYIRINQFQEIWSYGIVNMKAMHNTLSVADYMLKYVAKTLGDCEYIGKGKKFYITSMHLKKPIERYFDDLEIAEYINNIPTFTTLFEREYDSPYVGMFNYQKIRILTK